MVLGERGGVRGPAEVKGEGERTDLLLQVMRDKRETSERERKKRQFITIPAKVARDANVLMERTATRRSGVNESEMKTSPSQKNKKNKKSGLLDLRDVTADDR